MTYWKVFMSINNDPGGTQLLLGVFETKLKANEAIRDDQYNRRNRNLRGLMNYDLVAFEVERKLTQVEIDKILAEHRTSRPSGEQLQ